MVALRIGLAGLGGTVPRRRSQEERSSPVPREQWRTPAASRAASPSQALRDVKAKLDQYAMRMQSKPGGMRSQRSILTRDGSGHAGSRTETDLGESWPRAGVSNSFSPVDVSRRGPTSSSSDSASSCGVAYGLSRKGREMRKDAAAAVPHRKISWQQRGSPSSGRRVGAQRGAPELSRGAVAGASKDIADIDSRLHSLQKFLQDAKAKASKMAS